MHNTLFVFNTLLVKPDEILFFKYIQSIKRVVVKFVFHCMESNNVIIILFNCLIFKD